MDPLEVGRALRRRRQLASMTQAEVAHAIGTTQSAISRAEAGQVMPSVRFLERYAWATGRILSMDLGPPPRMRGVRWHSLGRERSAGDGDDVIEPVTSSLARERRAREGLDRGELTASEYARERLMAELELAEERSARI
jgi:transcriptional regulator with XRE-family HTH domain